MIYVQKSASKYHAKSTQYEGITYHSNLEAGYAEELTIRERAKDIRGWDRQVKLDLRINGQHITNYYIDFVVLHNDGSREYVEVKGMELGEWKLKWRILEATFDERKEHPDDRLTVIKQSSWRNVKPTWGKINNARIIT